MGSCGRGCGRSLRAGLNSPSFYDRPLTFLSFGINFALAEVRPFG